jgi:hypothetical protein
MRPGLIFAIQAKESFPGEALMNAAVEEVIQQNREACTYEDQRHVCWLYAEEIERQQVGRPS